MGICCRSEEDKGSVFSMRTKTFEDIQRQNNEKIIREALGEQYLSFSFKNFSLREHEERTEIECCVDVTDGAAALVESRGICGEGKGPVDAMFNSIIGEYVGDCISLERLFVEEFYIFVDEADLRKRVREGKTGTDAMVKTCLVINNGNDSLIPFRSERRSIILAMLEVVFSAVEFFINSERAMHSLRKYVEHAEERNRQDLVEKYTFKMAQLVKNTSYVESIRGMDD